MPNNDKHNKLIISMRYWLTGRQYHTALRALEFAKKYHTGVRKDGETPEFDHQIQIGHFIRTLGQSIMFPEESLSVCFLHDVAEDYDISFIELSKIFGEKTAEAVKHLTKVHRGKKIPAETYFDLMAECPIASIVKGADRIHNFQSMPGVFSTPKQISYIEECRSHIMPMLKKAKRLFPEQECAYENIKHMLESQIFLIEKIHEAQKDKENVKKGIRSSEDLD